jgi:L-ribulose-5-phosphate 4-epimerase
VNEANTRLRKELVLAHRDLARRGLALFTLSTASAIERGRGLVWITPGGVPYEALTAAMLVASDLDGHLQSGTLRPSPDLATHLALYRAFPDIGAVVHTHSHFATAWAQAGREIPCLGTTHARHFRGPVPLTAPLTPEAMAGAYEAGTGAAIVARFGGLDPMAVPAVLVAGHGPFCWGRTLSDAVDTAAMLEEVARLACHTITINHDAGAISPALHDRHFLRKHGDDRYYGQDPHQG